MSGSKMEALFLDPEFHRQGGGRWLVRHAQEMHGELTTDVNEQNPAARRFYQGCGFVVEGRSEVDDAGRPFPLLYMRLAAPNPARHPTGGHDGLPRAQGHSAPPAGELNVRLDSEGGGPCRAPRCRLFCCARQRSKGYRTSRCSRPGTRITVPPGPRLAPSEPAAELGVRRKGGNSHDRDI